MTDTSKALKPIRYRFTSHSSQPQKRRKIRTSRNGVKQSAAAALGTRNSARDSTPSSTTQSLASSHSTAPLHDCVIFFAQRYDDDEVVMSRARSLGANIAQSDSESTHVVLHAPHSSKKQQQQVLGWKEQGKYVVALTWVTACMSTWSRQPEFNHPPGRGDQSLVTGHSHTRKVSSNPFSHAPPPLDSLEDEVVTNEGLESITPTRLESTSTEADTEVDNPIPSSSNDSSLRTLEALAARYAKNSPPPPEQNRGSSTKLPANHIIQQKIRHAMAPNTSDPNIKIWTEEKMTPEGLMEKRRSGASRRKSLRLGYSKK